MEQKACPKMPLEPLPFTTKAVQRDVKIHNYSIKETMKTWSTIKTMSISRSVSRATKIEKKKSKHKQKKILYDVVRTKALGN